MIESFWDELEPTNSDSNFSNQIGDAESMKSGRYKIRSGRVVQLCDFQIGATYRGHYEGTSETVSRIILDRLNAAVRRAMPPGEPLVVIVPDEIPLPEFRIIAEFESRTGVVRTVPEANQFPSDENDSSSDPDIQSRLFVCWFVDELELTIDSLVESAVFDIEWDANAEDYDIMDF